jgi:hypothetical protein
VSKLNVYERLAAVREQVAYLQKEKQVDGAGGGYKVVTHDQVTANVRPEFHKQGILVVPKVLESRVVDAGATAKGTPIIRYEARFSIAFVNINEPADRVDVELDAHALDHGDKAPGKAVSYATKYAMLKVLSIETGEDDESRFEVKSVEEKAADVVGQWTKMIDSCTTLAQLEATWKDAPKVLHRALEERKNAAKDRITAVKKPAKANGDAQAEATA